MSSAETESSREKTGEPILKEDVDADKIRLGVSGAEGSPAVMGESASEFVGIVTEYGQYELKYRRRGCV